MQVFHKPSDEGKFFYLIAWYGLDGRKLQKHQMEEAQRQGGHLWASPVSTDVHRCQQMPTKLSISDGDFSAISWNCLHGLSVMGGVPSVPYILPNSLIILTAKACMKLYLIVWLLNALTSVMLESTLEIKLMQFCHSFFLSNISVNDSSSPIFEIFEFEIHSHLLNYLNLGLFLQTLCKRWMDGLIRWTQFLSGTMSVLEMALCFSYCEIGVYLSHCVLHSICSDFP